jgi:hypothetical protein
MKKIVIISIQLIIGNIRDTIGYNSQSINLIFVGPVKLSKEGH